MLDEIRQRAAAGGNSLWWAYRLVEVVAARANRATEEELDLAVDYFVQLATEDPAWAMQSLGDRGPAGHRLGQLLSPARTRRALAKLRLPSTREDAMLRARMLISSALWSARRKEVADTATWAEAWSELLRIPAVDRDGEWRTLALGPTSIVEYERFRELAEERLTELLTKDFDQSMFLPDAIATAARHGDWFSFESWTRRFRALPEPLRHGHSTAAIVNLEGLRALETGHTAEAVSAMRELVALGSGLTFPSNEDVSALPARLRESGRCPDLCDAFDALVQKRDWRDLPRLARGGSGASIAVMASSEEVLTYWFGSAAPDEPPGPDRMQLWFRGGEAVDQAIRQRFGDDVERARKGELAGWAETPRGRLALIILLDQFSRNLYRGSAEAFAKDALALELAVEGLDSGQDKALSCIEQLFFVLPLEHAEDLAMQDRALAYFKGWLKAVPAALHGMGQGVRDFAQQHRDVIARFGRFPTRNQALGRPSTPDEETHVREAKAAGRPV